MKKLVLILFCAPFSLHAMQSHSELQQQAQDASRQIIALRKTLGNYVPDKQLTGINSHLNSLKFAKNRLKSHDSEVHEGTITAEKSMMQLQKEKEYVQAMHRLTQESNFVAQGAENFLSQAAPALVQAKL